jgi:hypothetical protein
MPSISIRRALRVDRIRDVERRDDIDVGDKLRRGCVLAGKEDAAQGDDRKPIQQAHTDRRSGGPDGRPSGQHTPAGRKELPRLETR